MRSAEPQRRYRLYVLGNSLNNLGNAFYLVVLPLVVYRLTGSSLSMALTVAAEALSTLLLPLWGVWVDRTSPLATIAAALMFQACISAVLPLGLAGGWLTAPDVYVISFLVGVGANALGTAQARVVPMMFPASKARASAGLTTAYTATTVVGPLLAAAALAHHQELSLMWANSVSFLAPLALWPWTRIPAARPVAAGRERLPASLSAGLALLRQQRATAIPLVGALVALGLSYSVAAVFAAYRLLHDFHWPDAAVGLMFVALGLGGLVGTRLPLWQRRYPLHTWLAMDLALNAMGLAAMMAPWPGMIPVGLGLTGVGYLSLAVARNLWLQEAVPTTHLARANATIRTATGGAGLVGTVLLGVLSRGVGVEWSFGVLLLLGALPALWPLGRLLRSGASSRPAS